MRPLNDLGVELTLREREILELLVHDCMRTQAIAESLATTADAVKEAIYRVRKRFGAATTTELVRRLRPPVEKQSVPPAVKRALTPLMWSVAKDIADGYSRQQIVERTGRDIHGVRYHLQRLFDLTGCWSRLELAAWYDAHEIPSEGGICAG